MQCFITKRLAYYAKIIIQVRHVNHNWAPPSSDWNKQNTDISRIDSIRSTIIQYVCKDNREKIIQFSGKSTVDCPVLTGKTLTIREVIKTVISMSLSISLWKLTHKKLHYPFVRNIVVPNRYPILLNMLDRLLVILGMSELFTKNNIANT